MPKKISMDTKENQEKFTKNNPIKLSLIRSLVYNY